MSKILVTYFSASGVTAAKAEQIAKTVNADLFEIRPAELYTEADLDWRDKGSRSTVEMNDSASRPALAEGDAKITDYDTVFVGFPIWWYTAPRVINTFLEAYDFSGKKVILFATSGSSGFGKTAEDLRPCLSESAELIEGKVVSKLSDDELAAWLASLNL